MSALVDVAAVRPRERSALAAREDDELVALLRAGHPQAFAAIHERYRARLLGYARRVLRGAHHDAEDVVQDAFARAHAALLADARPVALHAWLYTIVRNRCIDELRRAGRPVELAEWAEPAPAEHSDPAVRFAEREEVQALVADIARLPERQRVALVLRELEGLSYEELAGALHITIPATKSLLVRARDNLAHSAEARDALHGPPRPLRRVSAAAA